MSNIKPCYICGKVYDHDYVFHTNKGECDREIAARQMRAWESIAASLKKMANPPAEIKSALGLDAEKLGF